MSVTFACPVCAVSHKVNDRYAGKLIRCKKCGGAIRVPANGKVMRPVEASAKAEVPLQVDEVAGQDEAAATRMTDAAEAGAAEKTETRVAEEPVGTMEVSDAPPAAADVSAPAVEAAPPIAVDEGPSVPAAASTAPMAEEMTEAAAPEAELPQSSAPAVEEEIVPPVVEVAAVPVEEKRAEEPAAPAPMPEPERVPEPEPAMAMTPEPARVEQEEEAVVGRIGPESSAGETSGAIVRTATATASVHFAGTAGTAGGAGKGTAVAAPPKNSGFFFQCPYFSKIKSHVAQTIGPVTALLQEPSSEGVRVDLLVVPPGDASPSEMHPRGQSHITVVTAGLSSYPMNIQPGREGSAMAELMICLPGDWMKFNADKTIDAASMASPERNWPMNWLRIIARQPALNHTFIGSGCLIPNDAIGRPFSDDTRLGSLLILPSVLNPKAGYMQMANRRFMQFYAMWFLYPEEMAFVRKKGIRAMLEMFTKNGVTEMVDLERKNVAEE